MCAKLSAIVLAAGRSSRMGMENKLLLDYSGTTILERLIAALTSVDAAPVIVVTGHEHDRIRALLQGSTVQVVHNPAYATGMASSIRCGVEAAPADAAGYMLCLGDMPLVSPETILSLVKTFAAQQKSSIVLPVYRNQRGHPVLFHRAFRDGLLHLQGDAGARSILQAHPDAVVEVATTDEGTVTDIDTPEQYHRLLHR